ncbi:hypothetical protein BD560DRAFT_383936 [Blakeslea trispora]|nr:hypothetical protein BD560DRAFT_383936 [Blakeslea trispora]
MFVKIRRDECTTVSRAGAHCGILRQSACRLLKEFNDNNSSTLLGFVPNAKTRGTKQKLFPQHTHFLIQYLKNHQSSTMVLIKNALLKQFPDIENIPIPSLWKHITIQCTFSLKIVSLYKKKGMLKGHSAFVMKW